ncbi:hypothetical protein WAI453_003919 [Rhynchosporium graminicola]
MVRFPRIELSESEQAMQALKASTCIRPCSSIMSSEYDFIVIGAGPAGCAIATRLAKSSSKPSVLLVEAGGDNKDAAYLVPADRFNLAFSQPQLNWGYKTAPQTHLKGQEIDYSRGKGLGGSTTINFSCWLIGADEDFDEWAKKVGDGTWRWKNVKERFKKIENYHVDIPREHQKYFNPKAESEFPVARSFSISLLTI